MGFKHQIVLMEPSIRIFWAFALLGTIVKTFDIYNILKKSNTGFLRFLRFPVAVCFPAAFIFLYYNRADSLTLSEFQMYLNLMRQKGDIHVQFVYQLYWATPSAKMSLFTSLLMTHMVEMAGSLIFHPPKENGQANKKFSITIFLVHWMLLNIFMFGGYILMILANVSHRFVSCGSLVVNILFKIGLLSIYTRIVLKYAGIIAPSLNTATLNASNSNQR